jgi:hypothetical protein
MKRFCFAAARALRMASRKVQGALNRELKPKRRIVLLVVATNRYFQLIEPLLVSADRHFLPSHDYEVLLFTNQDQSRECQDLVERRRGLRRGRIRVRRIEHQPWPMMTLLRYRFFTQAAADIAEFDFAFYSDCDMRFVADVGDEILGPGLTAVRHCLFEGKRREAFTFESRSASLAYIAAGKGERYYAGGFQGGAASAFLEAAAGCSRRIDADLDKDIVAIWHDESHWNALLAERPAELVVLDPGYCMAEKMCSPFPSMILALDKDHSVMRAE